MADGEVKQVQIKPILRTEYNEFFHELAWAIYYNFEGWTQRGIGSKKGLYRLFQKGAGMASKRTIDDWSGTEGGIRSKCRCPHHNWAKLCKLIQEGKMPAPSVKEVALKMKARGIEFYAPIPIPGEYEAEAEGEVGTPGFNEEVDETHLEAIRAARKFFAEGDTTVFKTAKEATDALKSSTEYALNRSKVFKVINVTGAALPTNGNNNHNTIEEHPQEALPSSTLKVGARRPNPVDVSVNSGYEEELNGKAQ